MTFGSIGIRTHLMLTTVGVVVVALGVTYLVVLPLVGSLLRTQHVAEAQRTAQLVASRLTLDTESTATNEGLDRELSRWRTALSPMCVGLAHASGELRPKDHESILQCTSLDHVKNALHSDSGFAWEDAPEQYLVVTVDLEADHIEYGPGSGSRLVLSTSMGNVQSRLAAVQTIILLFMGLAVGLVTLFGYVTLTHLVVRPIQRVVGALDGDRYGGVGTAEPSGGRELQELATSVNRLGRRLEDDENQISIQIGELKLINEELESTRDNLVRSEKLASVGRLAAGVAHEIGNPIGIVLGYLEMLQHPDTSHDQRKKYVGRALDATQRIGTILRDLLEFARPEVEQVNQITNVRRGVSSVTNLLRPQKRLQHASLDVEFFDKEAIPEARIAQRRFEQVLINLLLNAADATSHLPHGHAAIRVVVPEAIAGWVTIHIYDNGSGIPEEIQGQVFDPFFSTKEPGEGTGLGLSVCYSMVTSVGGDIIVDSTPGQGTCFTVNIPGK